MQENAAPAAASGPGKTKNIALLGFGTVGRSFAEVLAASGRTDLRITHVFNRFVDRKRSGPGAEFVPGTARWTDLVEEVLRAPDVDIVVELIGGVYPIEDWIRTALERGKHVVTANKQLIAIRGRDLFPLAAQHGRQLLYNAAVAGGVPVIPGLVQGLGGDQITRVSGILNGTCNFMLSAMEHGADYPEILREAQRLGYAEADPSADVDGYDARAKLCILVRLAMGADLKPESIPTQTISRVSAIDFAYARELDATIRQISRAERVGNGPASAVRARVAPMLVPRTSPLALSHGTQNTVVTSGRFGGDVVFSGHGAGGHATAVAVLSDVLAAAGNSLQLRPAASPSPVSGDVVAPHYLRFIVRDEPGIVAAIAGALATEHVNIDSVLQHRGHTSDKLPFVITTEPCLRSTLERAVAAMGSMSFMVEPPQVLQILTVDDRETD
jgi:homoserine dehydrogenase